MRCDVLVVVTIKNTVFWGVTPCSMQGTYIHINVYPTAQLLIQENCNLKC
jgi:hypothetical protein